MQDSKSATRRHAPIWMLGVCGASILALDVYFLRGGLARTEDPVLRTGIVALGLALGLCALALTWVLVRHFLGRYTRTIADEKLRLEAANEKLKELSLTDPLTGLYNRRFFDDHFRIEFRQSRRTGRPLSVLLVDLDNFKAINDGYGHDAGDQVLLAVAEVLREQVRRGGDLLARYGGEEFVAILPETDPKAASEIAHRILETIRARAIVWQGEVIRVTASLGIATGTGDYPSEISLFRAADAALYAAKRNGKNRVVAAEPQIAESTDAV